MPKYIVVLAHEDGEMTEKEYSPGWDMKKCGEEIIALACAVETTISSGRTSEGYNRRCQGVSVRYAEAA